jgi:hypothetical protein
MNKFREQLLHDPNASFTSQTAPDGKQLFITSSTNISGILDCIVRKPFTSPLPGL